MCIAQCVDALGEGVYEGLLRSGIEFTVTSKAVRYVLEVECAPKHFRKTVELVALRDEDGVRAVQYLVRR